MLHYGPETVEVSAHSRVSILSDGMFSVFALKDGEKLRIYGPYGSEVRKFNFLTDSDTDAIAIQCADTTAYTVHKAEPYDGKEHPDPQPIEVTLERPLTLKEEMQRFIREEISRTAQDTGAASFEEEDDFDVSYDEELPVSAYEFREIQDDYDPTYDPELSHAEQEKPASREPLPAQAMNAAAEPEKDPPDETPPTPP